MWLKNKINEEEETLQSPGGNVAAPLEPLSSLFCGSLTICFYKPLTSEPKLAAHRMRLLITSEKPFRAICRSPGLQSSAWTAAAKRWVNTESCC